MSEHTFLGFRRSDGSVGARNYVLVLGNGLVSQKICESVENTRTIITADVGTGRTSRDRETIARTLIGLGRNPNVAAVIVHEGGPGGYPELTPDRLLNEIAKSGKPAELLRCSAEGGDWPVISDGIRFARALVRDASRLRREVCPASRLSIGVKCGVSDPTSGLAGNPAVGAMLDRVIEQGGVGIFGETTEIIGAEHLLARHAINDEVSQRLLAAVTEIERRSLATGEDIRTINPVPANIKAGISTLEEKSLGAIHKAGSEPLQGFLKYGERPAGPGLYFADTYASALSIFGSHAASGCNLLLFQFGGSGGTNRTLPPSNAPVAPLMWTTASPISWARHQEDLDFYAGGIIEGKETIAEAGERLYRLVLDLASGTMTKSETVRHLDPLQIYLMDPMF